MDQRAGPARGRGNGDGVALAVADRDAVSGHRDGRGDCAAGILWRSEPNGYDVVEYHLQAPREWYDAGRIVPLRHNVYSFMPFNVEMHYLAAMHLRGGPWAGMYLAQNLHLAFVILSVLAIYGVIESGGDRRGAILAAVAAAVTPWLTLLAPMAYNEGGLLLFGALAIGWGLRAWSGRPSLGAKGFRVQGSEFGAEVSNRSAEADPTILPELALAGVFAGLACGVKLTAVPMLLVGIPAAMLLALAVTRAPTWRQAWMGLVIFVAAGLLVFSPWLIRNQVWMGNPIFPEGLEMLGPGYFSHAQVERFETAHAATPDKTRVTSRLKEGWRQILGDVRYGWILFPLAAAAAAIAWKQRRSAVAFLLALLLIHAVIWLLFTHLQSRFFVLAIPICALLIGLASWRGWMSAGAVAIAAMAIAGLPFLHRSFWPYDVPDWLGRESYAWRFPEEVQAAINGQQTIGLVGAQAFYYQMPSSRLKYRTIFDINARPGQNLIQAWIGREVVDVIIVEPVDFWILARTYRNLPPPPPVESRSEPFILRR